MTFMVSILAQVSLLSIIIGDGAAFTAHLACRPNRCTLLHSDLLNKYAVAEADISITLPTNWNNSNDGWAKEAAAMLKKYGVVALTSSENNGLINQDTCDNANEAAFTRVNELHRRIESRGLDPSGEDQPYRFAEIVCRDDGGRRFDVPIPWLGGGNSCGNHIGTPLESTERNAFQILHASTESIVKTVMDALWTDGINDCDTDASYVTAAGFLMNKPGSSSQNWHRDGPDEGYIDCFVPLIDLNDSIGPTAIIPGTHASTSRVDELAGKSDVLVPLLKKGDVLLFDYRTVHRGLGNLSEFTTRTLAYAVFRQNEVGSSDELGDIHNFPAALTLEYD